MNDLTNLLTSFKRKEENFYYYLKLEPANRESTFDSDDAELIRTYISEFNKITHKNKKRVLDSLVSIDENKKITIELYLESQASLEYPVRALRYFTNDILKGKLSDKFLFEKRVFDVKESTEYIKESAEYNEETKRESIKEDKDPIKEIIVLLEKNNAILTEIFSLLLKEK